MVDPKGQSDINSALKKAVQTMFPKDNSLPNVQKTLVLFIEEDVKLNEDGLTSARELRSRGVTILAVVIGSKVNIEGVDKVVGMNGKVIVLRKPEDKVPNILDVVDEIAKKGNHFEVHELIFVMYFL